MSPHVRQQRTQGFSTVEVIVVSAIVLVMVGAVALSLNTFFTLARNAAHSAAAAVLLEEAAEALLILRDTSWDAHIAPQTLGTPYQLAWSGSAYALTSASSTGEYRRTITFSEVERNGADVISASGTTDPNTRIVTIEVYKNDDDTLLASGMMLVHNSYEN